MAAVPSNNHTGAQLWQQWPPSRCTVPPAAAAVAVRYSCKVSKSVRDCTRAAPCNIAPAVAAVCASAARFACKSASVGTDCSKCARESLFRVQQASNLVLVL